MEERLRGIIGAVGELGPVEVHLIETLALLVALGALRLVLGTPVGRQVADERARYHWRKDVTYALALIGIVGVGRIWFEGMRAVTTFLGLVRPVWCLR